MRSLYIPEGRNYPGWKPETDQERITRRFLYPEEKFEGEGKWSRVVIKDPNWHYATRGRGNTFEVKASNLEEIFLKALRLHYFSSRCRGLYQEVDGHIAEVTIFQTKEKDVSDILDELWDTVWLQSTYLSLWYPSIPEVLLLEKLKEAEPLLFPGISLISTPIHHQFFD